MKSAEQLPPQILRYVADSDGRLANPGKKWEPSDYILDDSLPRRRLVWAVTDNEYFVIHYEWGGITRGYRIAILRLPKGMQKPTVLWQDVAVAEKLKDYSAFLATAHPAARAGQVEFLRDKLIAGLQDSWYDPPRQSHRFDTESALESDEFFPVLAESMPLAEKMLAQTPIIQIADSDTRTLIGSLLAPEPNTKLFLVRGLSWNSKTGGFSVYLRGNELLVSHNSLGRAPLPNMNRHALVVFLETMPDYVYVTCSMAE